MAAISLHRATGRVGGLSRGDAVFKILVTGLFAESLRLDLVAADAGADIASTVEATEAKL